MKKKDAVVQIITKLELGGAQKVCLEIAQGVHSQDTHMYIISGTEGPLIQAARQTGADIHLIPEFKREVSWKVFFNEFIAFKKLYCYLKQLKKNHSNVIVHTHSTKAGIMGRWAAWLAGIQQRVHTVHGFGFHKHQPWIIYSIHYLFELSCSLITTHYICVSSHDIEIGKKKLFYFSQNHSLIRAAVNWDSFFIPAQRIDSITNSSHEFIFGTVACFKPQKNLFDLLRAFKEVYTKNPHVKLEVIGDGILRNDIEQWIRQNNLASVITLHGWQNNVAMHVQNWNTFVLSSLWEGLPCAIVEARLSKLPIISYDTGGIKDIIIHGQNGFLYPQKKWSNLAQGMLYLANNPDKAHKLGMYNDNLTDFHSQHMVQQHIQLYKMIQG